MWRIWVGAGGTGPLMQVAYLPFSLLATVLSLRAARTRGISDQQRRVWHLCAVGMFGTWAGHVYLAIYAIIYRTVPFPSLADLCNAVFYLTFLYGMLSYPRSVDVRTHRLRLLLEVGAVLLGGAMTGGYFIDMVVALGQGGSMLRTLVLSAYAIGDVILFSGISFYVFVRRGESSQGPLTLVAVAMLLYVISDLVTFNLVVSRVAAPQDWLNFIRAAGQLTIAVAGQYGWHRASAGKNRPAWELPGWAVRYVPYTGLVMGYVLVLIMARRQAPLGLQILVAGSGVISVLTVIRQVLLLRDHQQLLMESEGLTAELRRSEARFRSLVQNSTDAIMIVGSEGQVRYLSPSIQHIFGYSLADLEAKAMANLVHPDDAPAAFETIAELLTQTGGTRKIHWRLLHADGTWRHAETVLNNLNHDEDVRGLVLNTRDVTERKQLEEQLRHQAYHDGLTSLANRLLLRERAELALRRRAARGAPVAVLLLDLDGFKHVNDSLGHTAGDRLLVAVAARLKASVRAGDTVARLGGDEFAVLLDNAGLGQAVATARHILQQLEAPFGVQDQTVFVSSSIGIAVAEPGYAVTVEDMLRNADVAMYTAKGRGKGCHAVFEPAMYAASRSRLENEADLRQAVEADEFVLLYQPLVDLRTGGMIAVEALVRWRHPMRGTVSPAEFIPLAEETGLIVPLGRWVLREACRQARQWQEQAGEEGAPHISVNLSAVQLEHPDLVEHVSAALQESGLKPKRLTLEITETSLLQATEQSRAVLLRLKALGVRLAIDDFGTGYS
ncbi:MAG TPA: EAL domain-containing protein, partial [Symbiobacteriaceae bacterium]|nr:EAL domain-containing protein [Symbiobacteriaceae bacterium]